MFVYAKNNTMFNGAHITTITEAHERVREVVDFFYEGYNRVKNPPCGNPFCTIHINDSIVPVLKFGYNPSGRAISSRDGWEVPCNICARAWEEKYPQDGPCWPYDKTNLEMKKFFEAKSFEDLNANLPPLSQESIEMLEKYNIKNEQKEEK